MNNKIDLHIHSIASDGADSVPVLLNKIQDKGIHTFSLSDHDTIEGTLLMESLVPDHLRFIRGVEFSCITPLRKCHILGYNFDPNEEYFQKALELVRKLRRKKVEVRISYLREKLGIILTENELSEIHEQASPGKPNFGKIIVDRGLAPDINTAIKQYINPCKTPADGIDSSIAIRGILQAGGIPVWAHPLGGEGERRLTESEFQIQLKELMNNGIRGLECYYSRYSQNEIQFLLEQSKKHHLLVSAGSDYHGTNKSNLDLGQLNTDNSLINLNDISLINEFF